MVQPNMKKLVAYSSVSHLGFVVLGIFSFTQLGLDGAVYQMLNHGISTGALFVLVGFLYERRHSLEITDYGGVATAAPWLSTAFLITTLASIGLPLLNNFVGEFLVLQGTALANFKWTDLRRDRRDPLRLLHAVAVPAGVLREARRRGPAPHASTSISREWAAIVPLIVMMVWMGVYSQSFPAAGGQGDGARARANTGERSVPGAALRARRGGRQCPLVSADCGRHDPLPARDRFSPSRARCSWCSTRCLHRRSSNAFGHLSLLALAGAIGGVDLRLRPRRAGLRRHARGGWLRHLLPRPGDRGRHPDRSRVVPLPGQRRTPRPANTTRCCCSPSPASA